MILMDIPVLAAGIAAIVIWVRQNSWWAKVGLTGLTYVVTVGLIIMAGGGFDQINGRAGLSMFFYTLGAVVAVMTGSGFGWLYRWLMHRTQ